MATKQRAALGLDFGTESIRALLVDLKGTELATSVVPFRHGQILETLPSSGQRLPTDYALQHPQDWIDSASEAVQQSLQKAGLPGENVISIGVDFTSCTMLPTLRDGTPMCQLEEWASHIFAWPRLWKHHGAKTQTDRLNAVARQRQEPWLARYGGIIGLEWFFPKVLEAIEEDDEVADATEVWLEAGDWFVWRLVGGSAEEIPRSTCQAGYKAMWSRASGYPSEEYFNAIDSRLSKVTREKLPGRYLSPGTSAGALCEEMASRMGLRAGTPVSTAIIDAHAGVPGAGAAEEGTLVMVLGTSSCHMLNARQEQIVPGVAGVVEDGILPGFYGYERGQAAVGDAFDWVRRLTGEARFDRLDAEARRLPPGSEGVLCLDWLNGCRTPLMDGHLRGAYQGLNLSHHAGHLYRATLEASAYGLRWIVELLRDHSVPVNRFIATGGLPHHNPLLNQIYADVLGETIEIHPSQQGPALGAAVLGALSAGEEVTGFRDAVEAMQAMANRELSPVLPQSENREAYAKCYRQYREWADSYQATT